MRFVTFICLIGIMAMTGCATASDIEIEPGIGGTVVVSPHVQSLSGHG